MLIQQWIANYQPSNRQEAEAALREIMQEICLAGLYRANFFSEACFYGGTALRIFHGLNRFSEDLDFCLLHKNPDFEIAPYFKSIVAEFEALGVEVTVYQKNKINQTPITSAFLKSDTTLAELALTQSNAILPTGLNPSIKIKLEIDTMPPLQFRTNALLLTKPFSFYVNCMELPDLFAGKLHALLFRKWKNRIKGRDWFDLEWYIRRGTPASLLHFNTRALENGDLSTPLASKDHLVQLLIDKIDSSNLELVKTDVLRFIRDPQAIDHWNRTYFTQLVRQIKVE